MYGTQIRTVELYDQLLSHEGDNAFSDVLEPWLTENADQVQWLADFQQRTNNDWRSATDEDLCRLYALYRVTSILLLRFQTGSADRTDYQGPQITRNDFQLFHELLGFHFADVRNFHPFYHEIVLVIQSDDPGTQIQIIEISWPCLMLGDLLYCRAACAVEG